MIATMNAHRSDACGTTHDGYVYVTGGFSGSECLGTAERYDPTVDQWSLISPMKCRRSGVGCVGFRDYVYAVGGFNGTSRLSSAEKYIRQTDFLFNQVAKRSLAGMVQVHQTWPVLDQRRSVPKRRSLADFTLSCYRRDSFGHLIAPSEKLHFLCSVTLGRCTVSMVYDI